MFLAFIRYGKVFKTSALGRLTVFLTGREASKILLSGKDGTVTLNLSYAGKQVLGPTSLLTTNGEEHKRLRRLIGDPLSIDALKKYFQFIDDLTIETLDKWPGRTVFVLEEASMVSEAMNIVLFKIGLLELPFKSSGSTAVHSQSNRQHDNELGAMW